MDRFDQKISVRMVVLGAVVGHLTGVAQRYHLPAEAVDLAGALAGYAYDALAFQVKARLSFGKPLGGA